MRTHAATRRARASGRGRPGRAFALLVRAFAAACALGLAGALASSSCSAPADTLCTPGENIFCKCPGGADGTKTCRADGQSFDPCVGDSGTCELTTSSSAGGAGGAGGSAVSTSTGTTTTSSASAGGGGGAGGGATFVVVRVGDGTTALSSAAQPVFLEERQLDGTLVATGQNPLPLPTAASGANVALTLSGTAASEGALGLSQDGHYLVIAGYDAAPGTANVPATTSATVARVAGRVDALGAVDTSTRLNAAFSGSNVRAAASVDGTAFWLTGSGSGPNGGLHFAPLGALGSTNIITTPSSTRIAHVVGGQLYADSATGGLATVFAVGVGTPKVTAGGTTPLPGLPATGGSPYGFVLLDRDAAVAGVDTLYLADDRSVASGGGITKWTYDGTTWTESATFKPTLSNGVRGLAALASATDVTLVATTADVSANDIVVVVDDGSATQSVKVVATAPTNQIYRGVAPSPH